MEQGGVFLCMNERVGGGRVQLQVVLAWMNEFDAMGSGVQSREVKKSAGRMDWPKKSVRSDLQEKKIWKNKEKDLSRQ